jgi:uncharacterized protein YkwD
MPRFLRALSPIVLTLLLAACSTGGLGLSAGLSQRMDTQGAKLDRSTALGVVNQYRASVGAGALTEDAGLDATADQLVAQYSKSGTQPPKPAGVLDIRYSAGYFTFAETFSGWRNSPTDAPALTDKAATKAGVAAIYDPNSGYGVYWVLLLE